MRTREYRALEQAAIHASQMLTNIEDKFDLDSEDGLKSAKGYLKYIERLMAIMKVEAQSR